MDLSIDRAGAVEQLAAGLRRSILRGELGPGQTLKESALARQLGVSRNTVREAIRSLVPGRLVRHVPHRGFLVGRLAAEDVADLYRARESIELEAVRDRFDAARKVLHRLQSVVGRLAAAANLRDGQGVLDAEEAFHLEVGRLLGSARLESFLADLLGELRLAWLQSGLAVGEPHHRVEAHRRLLSAIRDGDRAAAVRAFRRHLRDDARELHRLLAAG